MAVIYVKEQGALIQKRSERIIVSKNSKILLELSKDNIEDIAVVGNVQVTTQALQMLMQSGIDVSYFSYSGKYLGHTAAESSKNIFLRFEQYELYHDENRRLAFAKNIVWNKVQNQIDLIKNYRWSGEYDWKPDVEQMLYIREKLKGDITGNQILGIEGKCSNIYFGAFGKMFKCKCQFNGRNRRPPKDPINVIISLGYTLLTKEICSALDAESFEPYLGFLHGIRYGRKSLALDIIEEFRQPVVDRLAIRLFNKRMINELDFDMENNVIILSEDGFSKFCKEYERWMTGREYSGTGKSFRHEIKSQVSVLKKSIRNHELYSPFCWRQNEICG